MSIFDHMKEFKTPEEFEREGRRLIEELIESNPNEEQKLKARRLQFRIDRELRHYKDPISRMNKMVELFWRGTLEFNEVLQSASKKLGS